MYAKSLAAVGKCVDAVYYGWFWLLFKYKKIVGAVWLALVVGLAIFAMRFLDNTTTVITAPGGTDAANARNLLKTHFPEQANQIQLVVVAHTSDMNVTGTLKESLFLDQLGDYLNTSLRLSKEAKNLDHFFGEFWLKKESFYPFIESNLYSADYSSSVIAVFYQSKKKQTMAQTVRDILSKFSYNCEKDNLKQFSCENNYKKYFTIGVTGADTFYDDVKTGIENDLVSMDSIAIPLALLVFWYFLKNWKLLIPPLCSMLTSVIISFSIMYPIALYLLDVNSTTPALMTSVILALSTDYSLFLLTRLYEELEKPSDLEDTKRIELAVANMIYYAGHVILTSGGTLTITFLSMCLYPTSFLQSLGLGVAIALIVAIIVNLTVVPLLILTFPVFFSTETHYTSFLYQKVRRYIYNKYEPLEVTLLKPSLQKDQHEILYDRQSKSLWFRWAKCWEKPRNAMIAILVILALMISVGVFAFSLDSTQDSTQVFPRNADSVKVFKDLKRYFSAGVASPFKIQITFDNKLWNSSFWKEFDSNGYGANNYIIDLLVSNSLAAVSSCQSITSLDGIQFNQEMALDALKNPESNPINSAYAFAAETLLSPDQRAALTVIAVDFDPLGSHAGTWVRQVRSLLQTAALRYPGFTFTLSGGSVEQIDLVKVVNDQFPYMIIGTCVLLLLIVGFIFQSVFIPLRGVVTIGLSVAWVFGISVLYFQHILDHGIYWLVPIMSFTIVVGLGLDYDIFLISRIFEFRSRSFSTKASITKGVYQTGRIITGAGIIMAIAFAGLVFSHNTMLNEYALMLTAAVLLDTFVVRTVMVPSLMQLVGKWNWWPSNLKNQPDLYEEDDFIELLPLDGEASEELRVRQQRLMETIG